MSFASFASGSNDVVATSIAPSIAELIISAIEHERDREQQRDQLEPVDADHDRRDQHADRDREVDAHVPLRAEDVDDPLDRVVEALEQRQRAARRGRRGPRRRVPRSGCDSSGSGPRASLTGAAPRAPPSRRRGRSRAGAAARATSGARHASPTTCGQIDDVAELRAAARRAARRGRRSGTRARRSPRRSRGARASARGSRPAPTNAMPSSPSSTPSAASTRRASSTAAGSSTATPLRFSTSTSITGSLPCSVPVSSAWRR